MLKHKILKVTLIEHLNIHLGIDLFQELHFTIPLPEGTYPESPPAAFD